MYPNEFIDPNHSQIVRRLNSINPSYKGTKFLFQDTQNSKDMGTTIDLIKSYNNLNFDTRAAKNHNDLLDVIYRQKWLEEQGVIFPIRNEYWLDSTDRTNGWESIVALDHWCHYFNHESPSYFNRKLLLVPIKNLSFYITKINSVFDYKTELS